MLPLTEPMAFLVGFMGHVGVFVPHVANGLQVRGREEVKLLATGISASTRLFEEAVARNADALLVHYGVSLPRCTILAGPGGL